MLYKLQVGDYVRSYIGGSLTARDPLCLLYKVTSVSSKQAQAEAVANLPNNKYSGNHAGDVIRFSLPRGKVFGSSYKYIDRVHTSVTLVRRENARRIQDQEEKERRSQEREQERLAQARLLIPALGLQSTDLPGVFRIDWTLRNERLLGILLVTERTDAVFQDSDYNFSVEVMWVVKEPNGSIHRMSSGSVYGRTMQDAIYQWIADHL